jgi:dTDP-4-amino-4,6-dideoxyglucose formyltransferase
MYSGLNMKNVLIIIDNIKQYDRIKNLIISKKREDVDFVFCHSNLKTEIWDHPDFKDSTNSTIDLKKNIQEIINRFELVISVHCLQYFPKELVQNVRCINVHPGYNPINRGWYPQVFSIIKDLPIGATIHEIDEKLDHGKIIARKIVDKYIWDTSLTIYERVLEAELELFVNNFDLIIDNTYDLIEPESEGNIFLKKDFDFLCQLDLEESGKFIDFYNKLRALSHSDYKNAFFIDKETGRKVYVKIEITCE